MRKSLLTGLIIFICACGATTNQIPEWKDTASRQLESYKKSFLTGKESAADTHFNRAKNAIASSNNLNLVKPARNKDSIKAFEEISSIDDPLSRLIACGVWVKYLPYNESILQLAINTSAENGWKKPLWVYLTKLQNY